METTTKTNIHPTAVIESGAEIGDGCAIGPYAYVGGKARLGPECEIHHHATVVGKTTMGKGNAVHPHAVLGGLPQDLKYAGEESELVIGDGNVFRESMTVNLGTEGGGNLTRIGDNCLLMAYSHVAHDCDIDDRVVIANCVQLAGHIKVESDVVISGMAAVHHFCTLGRSCFVGGLSAVRQDVPPFMFAEGNPVRIRRVNVIGLQRRGMAEETMEALKEVFRIVYRSDLNRTQAIERIEEKADLVEHAEVREIIDSFRAGQQGSQGRARESMRRDNHYDSGK